VTVPDGAVQDKDTLAVAVAVTASPVGAAGAVTEVVTDTGEDWDPVPAALAAATVNVYAVDADRPVTVAVVPVTVTAEDGSAVEEPSSYTEYPVTVPGGAVHDRDTPVAELPVTLRPAGAAGTPVVAGADEDWALVPPEFQAATVKV
jgi:hypothetical protein